MGSRVFALDRKGKSYNWFHFLNIALIKLLLIAAVVCLCISQSNNNVICGGQGENYIIELKYKKYYDVEGVFMMWWTSVAILATAGLIFLVFLAF